VTTAVKSSEDEYIEQATFLVRQWCEGVITGDDRTNEQAKLMIKFRDSIGKDRLKEINKETILVMISDCQQRVSLVR